MHNLASSPPLSNPHLPLDSPMHLIGDSAVVTCPPPLSPFRHHGQVSALMPDPPALHSRVLLIPRL